MRNSLTWIALSLLITSNAFSQAKKETLNTAKDASYMGDFEKALWYEINLLRSDPPNYINQFQAEIEDLRKKVREGKKDASYMTTTAGDKTDTIRFDRNVNRLNKFEALKIALESKTPRPPLVPDEKFHVLTGSADADSRWNMDTLEYRIDKSLGRQSSTMNYTWWDPDFLTDKLYSEYSNPKINLDFLDLLLVDDPSSRMAVHQIEVKSDQYPYHIYITFGSRRKVATVLYKVTVEGLSNSTQQFVASVTGGKVMIGMDDVVKIADDNKVAWRYTIPDKGKFKIECQALLRDNSLLIGGWNNNNKKNNWWILKLDPAGNKVWEKSIPVKDGRILALAEASKDNGFWAIGYEHLSKKQFAETAVQFDAAGNEQSRIKLSGSAEYVSPLNLSDDVVLFPDELGVYVFGGTSGDELIGKWYQRGGEQNGSPAMEVMLEESAFFLKSLKGFTNFVIARNPSGGFYAAYTSQAVEGPKENSENYKLVALDSSLNVLWFREYGGDASDGLSSLILDSRGNPILAGFSYSGISGDKSEPAFEKDHCDVWVIKVNSMGDKIWDKTITGPGCILEAKLFNKDGNVGVLFKEETNMEISLIEEK